MKRAVTPIPLRASPAILEAWCQRVQVAEDFTRRGIPTVSVDTRLLLAMGQEFALLRSSNEHLRQLRAAPTEGETN